MIEQPPVKDPNLRFEWVKKRHNQTAQDTKFHSYKAKRNPPKNKGTHSFVTNSFSEAPGHTGNPVDIPTTVAKPVKEQAKKNQVKSRSKVNPSRVWHKMTDKLPSLKTSRGKTSAAIGLFLLLLFLLMVLVKVQTADGGLYTRFQLMGKVLAGKAGIAT